MKLKKLFLVSSLFLAGGIFATSGEVTNSVKAATGDTYKLVTDVSTLAAGDVVIVASSDGTAAISTTQNKNNRGKVDVTKTGDSIAYVTGLQEFTLEEGLTTGTFAFNTGSGYIYAAGGSNNNYLKIETTLSANSSWNITIASDGVATVKATGTGSKNWLRYNSNYSLFSCYANGQNDISLYKSITVSNTSTDYFQNETTTTKLTASYTKTTKMVESDGAKYGYEFTQKVFEKNETKALGDVNWTLAGSGASFGYTSNAQKFGSNNKPSKSMTLTSESPFVGVSSVKINTFGGSSIKATLTVTVGDTQVDETETLTGAATDYTFNTDTPLTGAVEFSYTQTSSKAIYIKSIEITYTGEAEQSTYIVKEAKIGFATLMSSKSYDASAKYGILVVKTDTLGKDYNIKDLLSTLAEDTDNDNKVSASELLFTLEDFGSSVTSYEITPVKCDVNGAEDENGDYYQFGVVFTGSLAKKDVSLTAVGYMELDGQVYLTSNETAYSLESLAQAYIDNGTFSGNADAIGVLNSIING